MQKRSLFLMLFAAILFVGLSGEMPDIATAQETRTDSFAESSEQRLLSENDTSLQDDTPNEGDTPDDDSLMPYEATQQNQVQPNDGLEEQYGMVTETQLEVVVDHYQEIDTYASEHEGDLEDGRYAILSNLPNSLALDVCGASSESGASIIIWPSKVSNNQRWDVKSVGGGYVTITSVSSGKVLDVFDARAIPGTPVIQWSNKDDSSRNQRWIISEEIDGSYKITSAMTTPDGGHLVLDVYGGVARAESPVCVFNDKIVNADNQRWRIEKPRENTVDELAKLHESDLPDGVYFIRSALGSNLVLDVENASSDYGARVIVWPKIPATNEAWRVTHNDMGYVVFESISSGEVLDVSGGYPNAGSDVIQWGRHPGSARNQMWIVSKQADETFKVSSAMIERELVLDVCGGDRRPGTKVCMWTDNVVETINQRWVFEPAPKQFQYAGSLASGTYMLASSSNQTQVLDVYEGYTSPNTKVILWPSRNVDNANQIWNVNYDRQGCLHISNVKSCLELAFHEGNLVQMTNSQGWVAVPLGNNKYRIFDPADGGVLGISSDGAIVKLDDDLSSDSQAWMFIPKNVAYATNSVTGDISIMGSCATTSAQAARYLRSVYNRNGWSLPLYWRNAGLSIEILVDLFWEEGAAEGVRPDVAFAQSLHETGYFQFGGDVIPEQFNFAGIGTTGGGVKGAYFGDARTGIRAQIQHLKAYASTAPLTHACVDPRFNLVSRGCATRLYALSGRWAVPGYSDEGGRRVYYHDSILSIMNAMSSH